MKIKGRVISNDNREVLRAARTYYVRADGNDANTGLANTSGGAFLTIQRSINVTSTIDCNGLNLTIQIGDGTYNESVNVYPVTGLGTGMFTIQGNSGTPTNVVVNGQATSAITAWSQCVVAIKNLKVTATTAGSGLAANQASIMSFSGIDFGVCAGQHILAFFGSQVVCNGNYTISGASPYHWLASYNALIWVPGYTITFSTNPTNFSGSFALATNASMLPCYSMTFNNKAYATGKRYDASVNGVINTAAGGSTYLPGNTGGSTATGGQYI
jgi:hypothetical protein